MTMITEMSSWKPNHLVYAVYIFVLYFKLKTVLSCTASEFECANTNCIDLSKRCDNSFDCVDSSDESNCDSPDICVEGSIRCPDGSCASTLEACPYTTEQADESTTTSQGEDQNSDNKNGLSPSAIIGIVFGIVVIVVIVVITMILIWKFKPQWLSRIVNFSKVTRKMRTFETIKQIKPPQHSKNNKVKAETNGSIKSTEKDQLNSQPQYKQGEMNNTFEKTRQPKLPQINTSKNSSNTAQNERNNLPPEWMNKTLEGTRSLPPLKTNLS